MPLCGLFGDGWHVMPLLRTLVRRRPASVYSQTGFAKRLTSTTSSYVFQTSLPASLATSLLISLPAIILTASARAQEATDHAIPALHDPSGLPPIPALPDDSTFEAAGAGLAMLPDLLLMTMMGSALLFALVTGITLMRTRRMAQKRLALADATIQGLQAQLDQSESLINSTDQLLIIWNGPEEGPEFRGSLPDLGQLPRGLSLLAFGQWLDIDSAQRIEDAIATLRSTGQRFELTAQSLNGLFVEFRGNPSGGRVLVQLRILEGEEQDRASLSHQTGRLSRELSRLKSLLDAVPMPVWSRDEEGRLSWINEAYREAVEGANLSDVLSGQVELLDQRGRDAIQAAHDVDLGEDLGEDLGAEPGRTASTARAIALNDRQAHVVIERLPVIVASKRQIYDVVDIAAAQGSVGIATDVSALEITQKALDRMKAFHANTMDQLTTPVAIFDSETRLRFYNAAYADQFQLEAAFLDQAPSDGEILDHLRANRRLPEQADFHGWKTDFLSGYRSVDASEHWWHLPDGQSLRVVAAPNPDGGVTYLFENVTERLDLKKRYNALIRVQTETLDNLSDGVIVFGSDGRVRVSNPAFTRLWDIPANLLEDQPHVGAVLEWCRRKFNDDAVWNSLKGAITGLEDKREGLNGQMECQDERILDYAAVPLPDGATMVTFVDVTDNVTVERGLLDRNEALMAADQLKNTFIQHVSYELRSPLTNIIGFTELLTSEAFGTLNDKQREYTNHITTSSSSLLAIVNDILDLATIDAGIMVLELGEVDPVNAISAAAEGLQDRLAEKDIHLEIAVDEDMGAFIGDQKRVRQVLYNLISNAIVFSDENSNISVNAHRADDEMIFSVHDSGCGIPQQFLDNAFERFESRNGGAARRGAGLGLSIVKSFVELHGGRVEIDSQEGEGTQVTCHFPIEPKLVEQAAE